MTPAYPELVAAVRREGSGLLAAAALGADAEIPSCPGWTVGDLVVHVGRIYRRVATLISTRATSRLDHEPELPEGEPIEVVGELLDDLVDQFGEADPDTPVWNWSEGPDVAAFWARRMAHESAVHRFDAQRAHGVAEPVDGELAADGVDELLDVLVPRVLSRDGTSLPDGGLCLVAEQDGGEWRLRLGPDGAERLDVAPAGATTVTGTTSALLLALYGRVPWDSLQVSGDADLVRGFTDAIRF